MKFERKETYSFLYSFHDGTRSRVFFIWQRSKYSKYEPSKFVIFAGDFIQINMIVWCNLMNSLEVEEKKYLDSEQERI